MSGNGSGPINIDFQVDKKNLFREETITDLKIASIQKLTPIHPDGSEDPSRETFYVGNTQLGTPHGPVSIQARLEGATLDQAMEAFPQAMNHGLKDFTVGMEVSALGVGFEFGVEAEEF